MMQQNLNDTAHAEIAADRAGEHRDELLATSARATQLERDIQTPLQMTVGGVRWPEGQDAAAVAHYIAQLRQQNILGVHQLKPVNRY
ncbi:hypothetical protein [Chromobacterium haemolyticum]|uniref:hypothetical protein n=1 Tax=Chromobacterium haemolyticum TaxID=394935 RepID=UPI0009D9EFEB|nr:hypothetical protein [Chromobacterium haemolyticum]OQS32103.1 hypothetical protein B0T39_23010 [Chromobacterium haemolyticum]